METQSVGSSGIAPSTLIAQGAQNAHAARAATGNVASATRDDLQTRRPDQVEPAQNTQNAQGARDTRTEQLRTERERDATQVASNERRDRENTYTATTTAAQVSGRSQAPGSVVDLRA
jgi:hypothetical protein